MAKKPKPTPGAAASRGVADQGDTNYTPGSKPVYIGIEAGSDLEQYGYQSTRTIAADPYAQTGPASFARNVTQTRKPRYKVGYLNSKDFARELGNMSPNVIEQYQIYMYQAGLLDNFTPKRLDKATRAAFKELVTSANQKGTRWQEELEVSIAAGGEVDGTSGSGSTRAPFVAELDDPVQLRETFQSAVQQIYGGNLPDAEVQAMVDAFRSQQMAKQQAAYSAAETGGTIEAEMNPQAFALAQVKEKHPQQLNRVKFTDTFDSILQTFTGGGQQ